MSRGTSATSQQSVQDEKRKLREFLKLIGTVPNEELEKAAINMKAEAIAMTPYETGKLEQSVYVRVSKSKTHQGLNAGASARDRGYNYAGIQHENTNYQHPVKGEDHFISKPFSKYIKEMSDRISKRMVMPK